MPDRQPIKHSRWNMEFRCSGSCVLPLGLLLWTFLQELIFLKNARRLLVDVKAVTLHRFRVAFVGNVWQAFVVLDV